MVTSTSEKIDVRKWKPNKILPDFVIGTRGGERPEDHSAKRPTDLTRGLKGQKDKKNQEVLDDHEDYEDRQDQREQS